MCSFLGSFQNSTTKLWQEILKNGRQSYLILKHFISRRCSDVVTYHFQPSFIIVSICVLIQCVYIFFKFISIPSLFLGLLKNHLNNHYVRKYGVSRKLVENIRNNREPKEIPSNSRTADATVAQLSNFIMSKAEP